MFLVSNTDIEYIKRYLAIMCACIKAKGNLSTKETNIVRMASNLLKKLEAKQPFPKDVLPDELKRFLK